MSANLAVGEAGTSLAERIAGKYLTFDLAEEEYGLEILRVREIIGMMDITPVPRTPEYVRGMINLRGKVIPVIDLRLKFGLPYKDPDDRTCVIVVDRVNEVVDVKGGEVEPTPNFGVSLDTTFILGMAKVGNKVKILLDIDRVLTSSEVAALSSF